VAFKEELLVEFLDALEKARIVGVTHRCVSTLLYASGENPVPPAHRI
jgi:hypothetical protein